MTVKPFDRVWKWATVTFAVAAYGLVIGLFFKLMLFAIPVTWSFWYGLCQFIYFIGKWAFRIGTPLFIIFCIVAFIGNLIYTLSQK